MHTRTWQRILGIGIAAGAIVGLTAAPGYARTTVDQEELLYGIFYDNVVTDFDGPPYILYTGGTLEDYCEAGSDEVSPVTNFVRTKVDPKTDDVVITERFTTRGVMALYEDEGLDSVQFIEKHCAAYASGDGVPQPVAVGSGLIHSWAKVVDDGAAPPHVVVWNDARGSVKTPDGDVLVVRGDAELTVSPVFIIHHVSLEVRNR